MNIDNKRKEIEQLVDKAVQSHDSRDAVHFTQAACNAANAMITLLNAEEMSRKK